MILMRSMPSRARSVGYSMPDGKYIAVGFLRGGFIVFDSTTGVEHAAKKHRREEVSVVRYSPNGRWLAVASHDNFIDIYDTQRSYKRVGVCKGHSSYVTHVDWSVDSTFLQSSSGDLELMFWDIPSCDHVAFANAMRDVVWHTQTCTVGYTVLGIWPKYADATDIVAADRGVRHHERNSFLARSSGRATFRGKVLVVARESRQAHDDGHFCLRCSSWQVDGEVHVARARRAEVHVPLPVSVERAHGRHFGDFAHDSET